MKSTIKLKQAAQRRTTAERIEKLLDSLPDDEVIRASDLTREIGCDAGHLSHIAMRLPGRIAKIGKSTFYGNQRAIAALKRMQP